MGGFILIMPNMNIFIIIPVSAIVYFGILVLLKEFGREDIELIKKIMNRSSK